MYLVLISSHIPNCSFLYLIGTPSPIPSLVSPILLHSSFLSWSSLWNTYCFVISFCSFLFCLFVVRTQRLANLIVLAQFYTANSSTVSISVFTHFTQQFTVCCLKFAANRLQCSSPPFHSRCAFLQIVSVYSFIARVKFGKLRSIKITIFVTIENIEINEKFSYLCEILIDLKRKWDLRRIMIFICRLASVDIYDIEY